MSPLFALSGDGKTLAHLIFDKATIAVVDVDTGNVRHRLAGRTEPVTSLALSHDGTQLASHAQGKEDRLLLWDVNAGKVARDGGDRGHSRFPRRIQ